MAEFITLSASSLDELNSLVFQYQLKGYKKVGDVYTKTIDDKVIYFQQMRKG